MLVPAFTAQAGLVTVGFTGTVTSIPDPTGVFAGAAVGDTFTGTVVYDTTAAIGTPGSNPAQYLDTGASTPPFASPLGISFTLNGVTIDARYTGGMLATIQNDLASNPAYPDAFLAQASAASPGAGALNPTIDLILVDSTGTALGSTDLPTSLDASWFTDGQLRFSNNTVGNVFDIFTGTIDTTAVAVPEPSSLALLGLGGLAALGLARRRRLAA
ncbi:PEP-CTERM sorting domain-containing protein [Paludisphaera soli]|uniref:PEP-CTERM sorting domain-containing protein n=1 Tax=Paludisphaera soli TaxID=2712865 RepID=UPI0013EBEC71|nr:PEP-CTERM sorting domain-containing protein [Paludisphaera soli]